MPDKRKNFKEYLGDGLYVQFDGFSFIITSENGIEVLDRVVLEPDFIERLIGYRKRIYAHFKVDNHLDDNGLLKAHVRR